jgi:uncharacterized membrane protein
MRKLIEFLEDTLVPIVAIVFAVGFPCWLLYKICAGIFYLLNKLIDKA